MSSHFDQIKSAFDRFSEAWTTHDGPTVAGFFVEDGALITPFGERADGREAIAATYADYFKGMLGGTSTTINLAKVRDIDDDHVFIDSEQTIYAADRSVVLVVHLAGVMRRESDGWRFVDGRPYVVASAGS